MALRGYVQQAKNERELRQNLETNGYSYAEKQALLQSRDNEANLGHNFRAAHALGNIPSIYRKDFQIPSRDVIKSNGEHDDGISEVQPDIKKEESIQFPEQSRLDRYQRRGRSQYQFVNNNYTGYKYGGLEGKRVERRLANQPTISVPVDPYVATHEHSIQEMQQRLQNVPELPSGPKFKREKEFELPMGYEQVVNEQFSRPIKKWQRVPGEVQRPDRIYDPNRNYPVDFNETDLLHQPKVPFSASFVNNPEILNRKAARHGDGFYLEGTNVRGMERDMRMGEERQTPIHGAIDDVNAMGRTGQQNIRNIGIQQLAYQDANTENELEYDGEILNDGHQNHSIRLQDDREYQSSDGNDIQTKIVQRNDGFQRGMAVRPREYEDPGNRGFQGLSMPRRYRNSHTQRLRDDRDNQDLSREHTNNDFSHTQRMQRGAREESMTLKQWKMANADTHGISGHVEPEQHRFMDNSDARPMQNKPRMGKPAKGDHTQLNTEHVTKRFGHPVRMGLKWRPRQIQSKEHDPSLDVSAAEAREYDRNGSGRGMIVKQQKFSDNSNNKPMGTPLEKPGRAQNLHTIRVKDDRNVKDGNHEKVDFTGVEGLATENLRGQTLQDLPYLDNNKQVTAIGIDRQRDLEYENPRIRNMTPRAINPKNKISIEGNQDFDATQKRVFVKQAPRPMGQREKFELWDPEVDLKQQRTRTKFRGLKVTNNRSYAEGQRNFGNVQNEQQKVNFGSHQQETGKPKFVRPLSRPSTPAMPSKKDLREEVEIIKRNFNLPEFK